MEDEQITSLAAGFGKAVADALAVNDEAREERAAARKTLAAEAAEAKRVAEKRSRALHGVIDSFESERRARRRAAMDAVADYCDKARADVLEPLKKDPRMPRYINYLERYRALMGMDDRSAVLSRLGATLDLADKILDAVGEVDAQEALTEAADDYARKVALLDGIQVADADRMSEDGQREALRPPVAAAPGSSEVAAAIEAAFAGAMGGLSAIEAEKFEEIEAAKAREKAIDDQLEAAEEAVAKAVEAIMRSRAESVAGAVLEVPHPADFDGEIVVKTTEDVGRVRELSAEVRKSFDTFAKVVGDNGLFAAFASEGSYGACSGTRFSWWWDDIIEEEYHGDKPGIEVYDDIPTGVEEDEGGDALETSIERMREFNKQEYWGLLDDDFSRHVDAFWYGFKKLMENVNGLFELDSRAFGAYCDQVSRAAQNAAGELGERMDDSQLKAFRKEVKIRVKAKQSKAKQRRLDDGR